jgi:hypothetical protein
MTRNQALPVSKRIAKALGLALVLCTALATQIPSTAEAAGRGMTRGGPGFGSIGSFGPMVHRRSGIGQAIGNSANDGAERASRGRHRLQMKHGPSVQPNGARGVSHDGWGCKNCGFTNGTQLTGLNMPSSGSLAPASVALPSGDIIDLLMPRPE